MNKFITAIATLLAIALGACSKPQQFTIQGELQNLRDRSVNAVWYDGASMHSQMPVLNEGSKFRIKGNSVRPVVMTLVLSDGTVAGTLIAQNGDNIKLKTDCDAPWLGEVTGSRSTGALYAFMAEHGADNPGKLNEMVAQYIRSHPEAPESTVLLTIAFITPGNEVRADSLLRSIAPQARPGSLLTGYQTLLGRQLSAETTNQISNMIFYGEGNTVKRFTPSMHSYSLLAVVADDRQQTDSLHAMLAQLPERPERRFYAMELSTAADSTAWALSLRADSVAHARVWAPAALADARTYKLSIPSVPYYILVDSTGNQLVRTGSVSRVGREIRKHI